MVIKKSNDIFGSKANKKAWRGDWAVVESMLAEADICEVLENEYDVVFGAEVGGWRNTHCPFPDHRDNNPSFGANSELGRYNCFACGGGNLLDFIKKIEGLSFPEAVQRLALIAGFDMDAEQSDQYRLLREIGNSIDEYLNRQAATELPGNMSEHQYMLSFAEQMRAYEAKVGGDPEEIAWVDDIYRYLDQLSEAEDQKEMKKLWYDIRKMTKARLAARGEQ